MDNFLIILTRVIQIPMIIFLGVCVAVILILIYEGFVWCLNKVVKEEPDA